MYTKLFQHKTLPQGQKVYATTFPTPGAVSFVGSVVLRGASHTDQEFLKVFAETLLEGTKKKDKKTIQVELDRLGATLSFGIDHTRLVFSGRVRTAQLPALLGLVSELLQTPTFPKKELATYITREMGNLALEAQNTRAQAGIAFARAVYKPTHPNYAYTTDESKKALQKVTSEALQSFHTKALCGQTLVFSIAGDIKLPKALTLVRAHFLTLPQNIPEQYGALPTKPVEAMQMAVPVANKASIDYFVGLAAGITSAHKDYPALLLGMQILGNNGFSGRLMRTVREKEGLTYGVYAYTSLFTTLLDGHVNVWATFAPELFKQGRAAVLREIRLLVEKGVTAEEVKKHRELFAARAAVQLSNSSSLARAAHSLGIENKPISWLDTFPKTILALTAKEINTAIQTYLLPEMLVEAAAGPVEKKAFEA